MATMVTSLGRRRVKKADINEEVEFGKAIISADDSQFLCTFCGCDLQSEDQARKHVVGWKHFRRARMVSSALACPSFDASASSVVGRIVAIGDCHGGRTCSLLLPQRTRSAFHGGSIYSRTCRDGGRQLPSLMSALRHQDLDHVCDGKWLVAIWSYGEIDVRCHASRWSGNGVGQEECEGGTALSLARAYVCAVLHEAEAAACAARAYQRGSGAASEARVYSIILAVPPASAGRNNDRAPFVGELIDRVAATKELNAALSEACREAGAGEALVFTGEDTWNFAMTSHQQHDGQLKVTAATSGPDNVAAVPGSLNADLSDGHVHVRSDLCGPVHSRLRDLLIRGLGLVA